MTELPLACNRGALDAGEIDRQRTLVSALRASIEEIRELSNGLAFRIPADKLTEVAELMGFERRCCSFLSLRLEARASEPHLWLELTGPPGTASFLREELNLS